MFDDVLAIVEETIGAVGGRPPFTRAAIVPVLVIPLLDFLWIR